MNKVAFLKTFVLLSILVSVALISQASAEEVVKKDVTGDWLVKADFNGRQMESILSLARDADGKLGGKWISFWGYSEIDEANFQDGKLSFSRTMSFRGNDSTSSFTGTIKEGKLTGNVTSDRGNYAVEGSPLLSCPLAGDWEFKFTRGEREFTSILAIQSDKEGNLTGEWKRPQRPEGEGEQNRQRQEGDQQRQRRSGPTVIKDVAFKDGKLMFTRVRGSEDRRRESKYELALKGDTLTGTTESSRGTTEITGKRANPPIVGKWDLAITSERGDRKQILTVFPDFTGRYGPTKIDKVTVEDNKVSFGLKFEFGERTFESNFAGQLDGTKLTGEFSSPQRDSTQKVTGKKI